MSSQLRGCSYDRDAGQSRLPRPRRQVFSEKSITYVRRRTILRTEFATHAATHAACGQTACPDARRGVMAELAASPQGVEGELGFLMAPRAEGSPVKFLSKHGATVPQHGRV
jgi:hypothetical protein